MAKIYVQIAGAIAPVIAGAITPAIFIAGQIAPAIFIAGQITPVIAPVIFIAGQIAPAITGEITAKFALPGFRTKQMKNNNINSVLLLY